MKNANFEVSHKLNLILIDGHVVDMMIGYSTAIFLSVSEEVYKLSFGKCLLWVDGHCQSIDSSEITSQLTLSEIFQSKVSNIAIDEKGSLVIFFDGDRKKIEVLSSEEVESWEIYGPNNFHIVCLPGGKIAVF